jgi:cell division protein FtsB
VRTGQVISSAQEELAAARVARKRRLVFIGLLAILIAALSVGGNRSLVRIYRMNKTRAELHREIERLKQANQELAEGVHSFANDTGQVESIAREDLGLVRPGEVVYQFGLTRSVPVPRTHAPVEKKAKPVH